MQDRPLIAGVFAKREEPGRKNAELREGIAILSGGIEGLDAVLDACSYRGNLVGSTPRADRIVLFYRNELRNYLWAEIRKADGPLTARHLAVLVCQPEGKDRRDWRLLTDVTRRVGCALRRMWASRMVEGERTKDGQVWRVMIATAAGAHRFAICLRPAKALEGLIGFVLVALVDCFRRKGVAGCGK